MSGLPTPAAASAPAATSPTTSSAPTSTPSSSGSPNGKPAPLSANQFRQQLRGQESSPFQDLESPLGVSHEDPQEDLNALPESELQETEDTETDVQEDAAQADYSWAEQLQQYKDGLYDTPLADLLQALSQGNIPEALWDKLSIPLKDGDYEWSDTLANARNGAMMRAKFTQKMQEFARERDAFNNERTELVSYLGGWKNDPTGAALLRGLRKMGMPFDAMARAYAQEQFELEELEAKAPGSRKLHEEKMRLEMELEEHRRNSTKNQQQETQQRSQQDTQRVAQAVKNAATKSFEQNGLQMTPGSWNVFREHLSALWTASGNDAPSIEMVREAVLATKEFVTQAQQQHQAKTQAQAAIKAPLTSRGTDGSGQRTVPKHSPVKKAMTASEFRKSLGTNPFR